MEALPDPPKRFSVPAAVVQLGAGSSLWRIYFRSGKHRTAWNELRHWGPTASRFDHHTRPKRYQARGILYATTGNDAILTALAEVFQETRLVDRGRAEPWLMAFELSQPVELLDTRQLWPVRAGGNMAIHSGSRAKARDWSRAIYRTYTNVQGIAYRSSIVSLPAVALFERARSTLPPHPSFHQPLTHPGLAAGLLHYAKRLGYGLR